MRRFRISRNSRAAPSSSNTAGRQWNRKELKKEFAKDVVLLKYVGINPVIVHGGGPRIERLLKKLDIPTRFVDGLRVTDADTLEVVEMVLSGSINKEIVQAIHNAGGEAIGLSGKDGRLITAEKVKGKDIGFVGDVTKVNGELVRKISESGYIPVIAPLAAGTDGSTYNVNADTAAGHVAKELAAEKLVLLTDVPGILDASLKTISSLDIKQAGEPRCERYSQRGHDTEDQVLPRRTRRRGQESAYNRRPRRPCAAPGGIYRPWHRHADSGRIAMQQEWIEKGNKYLANTYKRFPIGIARGEGCWLWDLSGRRYLDFLSGISVCNLGHAPASVVDAICAQARRLLHISNLFYTESQIKAAELIVRHSFGDKVFFCNSGAEANEAAIKLVRRYSWKNHGEGRADVVAMENSFHGRTIATLSATGQQKFQVGFSPMVEGFSFVPFNDMKAIKKAVSEKTCAVIIECIQSEGGVFVADQQYMKELREFTAERDILLVFDEVQTGMGRTGKLFGYEHYGIEPDIMSLAKALGSGFPVGAIVAKDKVMEAFDQGSHASTFGGNPLASAAVIATIDTMMDEGIVGRCAAVGAYLLDGLLKLKKEFPSIIDVRGLGLLLGVEFDSDVAPIVQEFLAEGVILYASKGNVIRLLPPLIIGQDEVNIFLEIAKKILERRSGR